MVGDRGLPEVRVQDKTLSHTHTHRHTTLTWDRHLIVEAVISAKIKAMQNIELIWL